MKTPALIPNLLDSNDQRARGAVQLALTTEHLQYERFRGHRKVEDSHTKKRRSKDLNKHLRRRAFATIVNSF